MCVRAGGMCMSCGGTHLPQWAGNKVPGRGRKYGSSAEALWAQSDPAEACSDLPALGETQVPAHAGSHSALPHPKRLICSC